MKKDKAILIGATTSGSGKTTFTMGLLRALSNRGLRVQPFKSGPDYIDPLYHQQAAGQESVNLDTFMGTPEHVKHLFTHYGHDADIRVVEGAMGLFDGYDGPRGSAAEVAMLLDVPVVLLVSARATAYSVAPLIYGFRHFNPQLHLAGVVFNFVASERQYATLRQACHDAGVSCLGYMGRNDALVIPSRHLGLTIETRQQTEQLITEAAREVEAHVEIERLIEACDNRTTAQPNSQFSLLNSQFSTLNSQFSTLNSQLRLSVARDEAFNFIYRANIDALRRMGTVTFFSPLRDRELPPCDLLYLPGGYPELFAAQLEANTPMCRAIRAYAEAGGHMLAECGGFMYLCHDIDGHTMCGVLPLHTTMQGARLHLGYRQMTIGGETLRGHEFHYSRVCDDLTSADVHELRLQRSALKVPVDTPIYRYKNVVAGYTHWYWAATSIDRLWNI